MQKQSVAMLIVGLGLMAAAAGFIEHRKDHQQLGQPGVKLSSEGVYDTDGNQVASNSVALPKQVLDFESEQQPMTRLVLDWLPKDTTYGQRIYRAPDGLQIGVTAVLMGSDRTSIHKPEYCLTGTGWQITGTEQRQIPMLEPSPYQLPVVKMQLQRDLKLPSGETVRGHGFYVYWFVADQQLTAQHNERMWWMSRDLLRTGVLQRWAYVSCLVMYEPGQEEKTFNRLQEFLQAAVPQFQVAPGTAGAIAQASQKHP